MGNNNKILYLQAGGPTSVINASFLGLFDEAKKHDSQVYVSPYGLSSLLKDQIIEIKNINHNSLIKRPGSYFGSARIHLKDIDTIDMIIKTLANNNIHQIFINGGNDTMDSALKISSAAKRKKYDLQVIGIPKTIDNDLKETDHTPGYASASKFIINALASIIIDDLSYKKGRVNIIEVMGRDSGYLALASNLVRKNGFAIDLTYIPEVPFSIDDFAKKASEIYESKGRCITVVSEGIKDQHGKLISSMQTEDAFGNIQMGGVSSYLANYLTRKGLKTRGIELNVLQRSAFFLTSEIDVKESYQAGKAAFRFANKQLSDVMVSFKRISNNPYKIQFVPVPLSKVAKLPAELNLQFYDSKKQRATKAFYDYLTPLLGKNFLKIALDI